MALTEHPLAPRGPARRSGRLRLADELAHAVLRGDQLEDVLAAVTDRARDLLRAEVAEVVVTQEGVLQLRQVDGSTWSFDEDGCGLEVLGPHERSALACDGPTVLDQEQGRFLLGVAAPGPAVLVPLADVGHTSGLLMLARPVGGPPFDDVDLFVAGSLGAEAARVVEYDAMRGARERVAALEERDRIARDLHDGIIQSLFAVGLTAQSLALLEDVEEVRAGLAEAVQMIDGTIRDLRGYVFGPDERDGSVDLGEVLRATAASFGPALRRLEVRLDDRAVASLGEHGPDILQTVREALSNVARHAGARRVSLTVAPVGDGTAVLVEVADDGRGFDPQAAAQRGHGVANLAARAQRVGAALSIDSAPGRGCCLQLKVPVASGGPHWEALSSPAR